MTDSGGGGGALEDSESSLWHLNFHWCLRDWPLTLRIASVTDGYRPWLGPFVTSVRWNWIMDDPPITRLSGSKRFESVLRTPIRCHGLSLSRGRSTFHPPRAPLSNFFSSLFSSLFVLFLFFPLFFRFARARTQRFSFRFVSSRFVQVVFMWSDLSWLVPVGKNGKSCRAVGQRLRSDAVLSHSQ